MAAQAGPHTAASDAFIIMLTVIPSIVSPNVIAGSVLGIPTHTQKMARRPHSLGAASRAALPARAGVRARSEACMHFPAGRTGAATGPHPQIARSAAVAQLPARKFFRSLLETERASAARQHVVSSGIEPALRTYRLWVHTLPQRMCSTAGTQFNHYDPPRATPVSLT